MLLTTLSGAGTNQQPELDLQRVIRIATSPPMPDYPAMTAGPGRVAHLLMASYRTTGGATGSM